MLLIRSRILLGALTLVSMLLVPQAGGAVVPNPVVEGPVAGGIRGRPWNSSLFDGPRSDASCYDTANAAGDENGPLSGPLRDLSFDPRLPLGAQSALRDVSCNVVVPLGL